MGSLGRGMIYIQEWGYPDTDTRQFVGGLGRHEKVIYTGLSGNDYTLGYPRLTLDMSRGLTKRGHDSLQPDKAWLLKPNKVWLLQKK